MKYQDMPYERVDFDRVDLSNLNRQQYFTFQLGRYKAEALAAEAFRTFLLAYARGEE